MGWPSPSGMAESEWNGRVLMVEFENRLAESSWLSLDRVADSESSWPNPNELADSESSWPSTLELAESSWPSPIDWPNHPGRVRLADRITLTESDWLAESE